MPAVQTVPFSQLYFRPLLKSDMAGRVIYPSGLFLFPMSRMWYNVINICEQENQSWIILKEYQKAC